MCDGNGSCVVDPEAAFGGCHGGQQPDTGQYRRQIVEATIGDGGGDFVRWSRHVTDGTTTEVVLGADC